MSVPTTGTPQTDKVAGIPTDLLTAQAVRHLRELVPDHVDYEPPNHVYGLEAEAQVDAYDVHWVDMDEEATGYAEMIVGYRWVGRWTGRRFATGSVYVRLELRSYDPDKGDDGGLTYTAEDGSEIKVYERVEHVRLTVRSWPLLLTDPPGTHDEFLRKMAMMAVAR